MLQHPPPSVQPIAPPSGLPLIVGVDVSKARLDVCLLRGEERRRHSFANDGPGLQALLETLAQQRPEWVVLEPTGVYHLALVAALHTAGHRLSLVNPASVKALGTGLGRRHKTDAQDAWLLAHLGQLRSAELEPYLPKDSRLERLEGLVKYREDELGLLTATRNRLSAARLAGEARVVAWLTADLAALPVAEVLQQIKGVGPWTTALVLALLPQSVWGRAKAAAAYAGLHPRLFQSGSSLKKTQLSRQGNRLLRKGLYMAGLVAARHDELVKAFSFYGRLVGRGMAKKAAVVACAHELLRRMMGVMREFLAAQAELPPRPTVPA